ncbi:prolyl-tRNA editing protein [Alphaproteobacteria bacterium]|nr:prolyl-tRNA editing protein [Alphaproteobacteria bacterium]
MPEIPAKVMAVLNARGLAPMEAAECSATVAQAAASFGVPEGSIAKSLLVKGKDGYAMIVMSGDKRLSNQKMRQLLGCRKVSMADRDTTFALTGFPVGGVCPFGVDQAQVPVFIDESLRPYGIVYPACGTRTSCVKIEFSALLEIASGRLCDVAEA